MDNSKQTFLFDFVKNNAWALVIVFASVVGQWYVFTARLDNIEARQDRQGTALQDLQTSVAGVQTQYAALSAKLDAIDSNVNYIRSRIDAAH